MAAQQPKETAGAVYHPWTTYIAAREEARRRGDRKVGTEHLLLALLLEPELTDAIGSDLAAARAALGELDRQALATVGLHEQVEVPALSSTPPLELPRRPTVRAVLHGRLPLTPAAKRVLQASSKGVRRGRAHPGSTYVLLSLLDLGRPDPAAELLARLGVDPAAVRERAARVEHQRAD
jgi:ATP-dependent Clp protease ATP-binding subunit ClpA